MADFLLVHGSFHGAWCWRDLIPALTARGHMARAIDLPGHGQDHTPPEQQTLAGCRDAVLAASTPQTIVVGHSWGGYPISAAAEADPRAMRALIYLCAYVPVSGLSLVDMRKAAKEQPLLPAIQRDPDGLSCSVLPSRAVETFYHDCPPDSIAYALNRLQPQIIAPQTTPLFVSARFASVPKAYIRCARDRTIPPEYQSEMTRDWPADRLYQMDSAHSPFFSDPAGLAAMLNTIAGRL
ncbi:alpha/beta fold hydrolase [Sedimentitalea sp. HM32M-2]|uniref:alpha/beta fold hydrolase n=1 Tax=Sedimentitalea sp. HM32M-2 TaxID=3351566 RepID=UPI0036256A09